LSPAIGGLAAAALALAPLLPGARAQDGAPPAPPPPPGPGGAAAPASGIEGDRKHVSLNLKGVPLADVLRTLGDLYELNLILPKDVSGNVTLVLKDVPIEEALEQIAAQYGYAILPQGSILRVIPQDQLPSAAPPGRQLGSATWTADVPGIAASEIKLYDVHYARGEDLVALIQPLITPKIGYVAYNPTTQKLVVRDLPENLAKIADVIAKIDVQPVEDASKAGGQLPAAIKVVRLRYVETAALKTVLTTISKAEGVDVEEEATTKSFVLRGYPERIAAVERMIQTLDQRTPQVRIKVRIVETALGNDEKLGINWTMRLKANGAARPWSFPFPAHTPPSWVFYPTPNPASSVTTGGAGGAGGANSLAGFSPGDAMPQVLSSSFTFGVLDASQFSALLEAISVDTKSDLLASPQLTTLDNHKAKITLGTILPVPIYTNVLNQQTGTVFPTITGFTDIETGTILNVTPRVGADEYITLDVAPEISEITGFVGQNQERPIRAQRRMDTSVILRSGATLVLGGLNQNKTTETVSGVPVLSSIPLLGRLFTHKAFDLTKTDLIIFITPEIVKEESELAAESTAEKSKRERGLVKIGENWVSASLVDAANRAVQRLDSTSPQTRREAVLEIAQMSEAERQDVLKRGDVLTNVLRRDTDIDVKRLAAEALGAVDPARLASELATLPGSTPLQAVGEVLVPMALRTPSRSIRTLILANAIKVDRASTVTALMAAVSFGKPFERLAAAEGLALAGDPASVSALAEAVREGKPALAAAAVDALGACGGQRAVQALVDELARRPEAHVQLHLAAALGEALGDDARLAKELGARGLTLPVRTQELALREHHGHRARADRALKAYAGVETADAPEVTGPADAVRRVREALQLLADGSPGHRHLVAVALRGIDIAPAPKEAPVRPGAPAAPPAPAAARAPEHVEGGRLKLTQADVEATPAIHLAHDLVYHAALADVLAPGDAKGAGERQPAAAAGTGPIGHRAEEAALREQYLSIQAMAGRQDFREVDGSAASIEEALQARDLSPAAAKPQGR
jgi:type II secretory pathway component GspD/PulD (secretin)